MPSFSNTAVVIIHDVGPALAPEVLHTIPRLNSVTSYTAFLKRAPNASLRE
jgi:hypothetical protein